MLALGIILILLSAGALVVALTSGSGENATLFSGNVELPTFVVFLAGAATLLVFIMGLELFRSGVRRANRNRKDSRRLRKLEQQQRGASGEPTGERTTSTGQPNETPPPPAS